MYLPKLSILDSIHTQRWNVYMYTLERQRNTNGRPNEQNKKKFEIQQKSHHNGFWMFECVLVHSNEVIAMCKSTNISLSTRFTKFIKFTYFFPWLLLLKWLCDAARIEHTFYY